MGLHKLNKINQKATLLIDPLPNDKILDWSKLKAFADNIIKILKMMIFVFDRVENLVGKGENAGNLHCFSFIVFKRLFTQGR